MQLISRGREDSVAGGLKVTARDNLQSITNVDDKCTRLVGHVVPLLVLAPNLQARDRHREQQSGQTEVGVTVHPEPLGLLAG